MADTTGSTVVGPSILINGNLQGDEDLTVLGRVEGSIRLTRTLNIEESGIVKANIEVRNAVVSGVVVGNITATDSVEITEAGRMVGDIKAPRVIIVDGARFRGAVDMGDMETPRATGTLPARTVERTALAARTPVGAGARPGAAATPVAARGVVAAAAPVARRPAPSAPPPMAAAAKRAEEPTAPAGPRQPLVAPLAAKKIKKKVVVKKTF